MKRRKFGTGGVTDDDLEAANASEDPIAELNARKGWTGSDASASAAKAKPRVVSKAELEKSGLSLRDFLNKERGLTRRKDPASSAPAEAGAGRGVGYKETPAKSTAASEPARKASVSDIPGSSPKGWTGGTGEREDSTELGRNLNNALNATPGIQAVGRMAGASKAAQKAGSRALAAAETPVTYLGKSGARQVAGGEEIAQAARKAITDNPTRQLSGPPKQLSGPRGGAKQDVADVVAKAKKVKKVLDESDTTGGAIGYKKGGNVKGWGMARGARAAKIR